MRRFPLAFLLSILLHVGLFALAFISWKNAPKTPVVTSVPVELVAKIPSREQAEAPVDKLAVKPPQPIPAPEEQPKPVPPTPAPKLPVPVPQKAVVPEKKPELKPVPQPKPPEPKPTLKPADKTPPDKNGMKKPVPPVPDKKAAPPKPALDLDALAKMAAAPSKAPARTLAQANTRKTNGASNAGSGPADAGNTQVALGDLGRKLGRLWSPNCTAAGAGQVIIEITVRFSPNGRVIAGPTWTNRRNDSLWESGFSRAGAAIARGEQEQLYVGLPSGAYNVDVPFEFNAKTTCDNQ